MTRYVDRRAVILAALFFVPAGVALAQGGPPFGGSFGGPQGGPPFARGEGGPPYSSGQGGPPAWGRRDGPPNSSTAQVDRSKVEAAVKEALGKATKGTVWTSPRGPKMTPLMVDNEVVGQLWEDADPKSLTAASFWARYGGVNVELAKNGKVIGMLWIKVS
jgi:hypothetical protein